ncbi:hypothetical protein ABZS29_09945 [Kribbella sp. NPDC005582]|uniref:hypothetical protein n=1 Tax=Kribbella sp. NPDC005582 TaxID=3156893 RepID=UPI0033A4B0DF
MSYPPPGGIAAPDYGRPPRKNRAGLFIALMLVLLIAVLGTGVYVATKVVSSIKPDPSTPPPAPVTSVAPPPKPTTSAKPNSTTSAKPRPTTSVKPRVTAKPVPVKPLPVTPAPSNSAQVAARFAARLNANDADGATALACADTKQSIPVVMRQFVRQPASLTVSKAAVSKAGPIEVFSLSGSMRDAAAGGILVVEITGRPCVKSFLLRP